MKRYILDTSKFISEHEVIDLLSVLINKEFKEKEIPERLRFYFKESDD